MGLLFLLNAYSLIVGGLHNAILGGGASMIVSGSGNMITGSYLSSIVGGVENTITHTGANTSVGLFIGAGGKNLITDHYVISIGFGQQYSCPGPNIDYSLIVGGYANRIFPYCFEITKGGENPISTIIDADVSVIGNGSGNMVAGYANILGGGETNGILGVGNMLLGGYGNGVLGNGHAIFGGSGNSINFSQYGVILGGEENMIQQVVDMSGEEIVLGGYSLVGGIRARGGQQYPHSFVWNTTGYVVEGGGGGLGSIGSSDFFSTTKPGTFIINAYGGVGIQTNTIATGVDLEINDTIRIQPRNEIQPFACDEEAKLGSFFFYTSGNVGYPCICVQLANTTGWAPVSEEGISPGFCGNP